MAEKSTLAAHAGASAEKAVQEPGESEFGPSGQATAELSATGSPSTGDRAQVKVWCAQLFPLKRSGGDARRSRSVVAANLTFRRTTEREACVHSTQICYPHA